MKYTITILLFFLAGVCKGQRTVITFTKQLNKEIKRTASYFYKMGLRNDKAMRKNGYTKSIDSVVIEYYMHDKQTDIHLHPEDNFKMADSVWVNYDTTWIVFRYYKKLNVP